ncbi:hypothetical protein [Caenispirillum bisanense]|uniref:hypothetical protein n=1 Tax=Caenispirillum bisanense TaxID=414052 RepID=UPI0031D9C0BE
MDEVADYQIVINLPEDVAMDFAQMVKRLSRRNIGPSGLDLATSYEEGGAETGLAHLAAALASAGLNPR